MPSRAELQRFFFLDDAAMELTDKRRSDYNLAGFALQLEDRQSLPRHGTGGPGGVDQVSRKEARGWSGGLLVPEDALDDGGVLG
jgi:hypothetical protein